MRLALYFYANIPDANVSDYNIAVADDSGNEIVPTDMQFEYLKSRAGDIKTKAQKVLGENYEQLYIDNLCRTLTLKVTVGTSTGEKRFDFRSLCGWIELHDFT